MRLDPRRILGELTGRADREIVRMLVRQADTAIRAAELVRDVAARGREYDVGLREQIRVIEHEGDEQRAELVNALSGALVTPIDREDVYRLSRGIDDVLDNLRDFSREWDLYGMDRDPFFAPLLDEVVDGLAELRQAAGYIIDDPSAIARGALEAKRAGNRIRRNYQTAMATLFKETGDAPVTVDVLRRRELLRRLDIVGLRIREAAALLADAAVKRSH
jgi:uncharacterized protein